MFGFLQDKGIPALEGMVGWFERATTEGTPLNDKLKGMGERAREVARWFRDEVTPRLKDFAGWVKNEVVPWVKRMYDRFQEDVLPVLRRIGSYLKDTFTPVWKELVAQYRENVQPALQRLKKAIDDNRPALETVARVTGTLTAALLWLQTQIQSKVMQILIKLAGYLAGQVIDAISGTIREVGWLVDKAKSIWEWFGKVRDRLQTFKEKLDAIKLPGWLTTLNNIMNNISDKVSNAGSNVGRFFGIGDAPGWFRGTSIGGGRSAQGYSGTALNRVRSVLPGGLRITSTYRSPEHNRRDGGSPTSLHMDRANPAVDIGGPTRLLDEFAARLRAMGGWRQLLWRVAGHFDHIHVAHAGGIVQRGWARMPGDAWDERTARLQVGEAVLPKGWEAGLKGDTYIIDGMVLGSDDLPPEVVAFFRSLKRRSRQVAGR